MVESEYKVGIRAHLVRTLTRKHRTIGGWGGKRQWMAVEETGGRRQLSCTCYHEAEKCSKQNIISLQQLLVLNILPVMHDFF
ncbi:hypothetical protein XELAEV_18012489mg [Xenopus laevis]|uniref:Uncharacterized protein n=1 Tax=Xenopus laevis TaxID=8355 RepID=A0A974DMM6_XENLA|nr:hypothetical protein XELAEV_18012489mg [Xenopus laevis]